MRKLLGGLLVALTLVFAGLVAMHDIVSPDLGVHVRTGERMLSEATIPDADQFSHTARGNPAHIDQWAGSILLYLVDRATGPQGLVLLRVLLVLATFFTLLRTASLGKAKPEIGFALFGALGIIAAAPLFLIRPPLFGMLFLAGTAFLLESFREGRRDSLWILVPLFGLWSTMDPAFLYGLAFVACFVIGEGGARLFPTLSLLGKPVVKSRWRHMALVLAVSTAVPLLLAEWMLPGGARAIFTSLGHPANAFYSAVIDEFQPANLVRDRAFFWLLGLAVTAALSRFVLERTIDLASALALVLFASLSLFAIHMIPMFVVVSLPPAMRDSSYWPMRFLQRRKTLGSILSIAAVVGLAGLSLWWRSNDPLHGRGLDRQIYPLEAFQYLEENDLPGPLFHAEQYGGPLLWYFGNDRPVFIDGRLALFGEDFRRNAYFHILGGGPDWQHQLDHFGINTLLLRRGDFAGRDKIGSLARESDIWRLAYFDDEVMMYVRRSAVAGRNDLANLDELDPEVDIVPTSVQQELAMWEALYAWMPIRGSARSFEIAWRLLALREDWEQIGGTSGLKSIVTASNASFFYRLRGDARFALQKFEWAGSDWKKAGSPLARSSLGLFSYLDDRSMDQLARRIEDRAGEYARLASLLLNAGEPAAAFDLYREAHEISSSPHDGNGAAWALLETGEDREDALKLARDAVNAEPENGWFRGTLGRALAASGEHAGAEAELVLATQLLPADDYMARGKAHARLALFYSSRAGRERDAVRAGIDALLVDAKTTLRNDVVRVLMNTGGEAAFDEIMEQLCYDLGLGTHMGPEHAHMGHGDMPAELKHRLLIDAGINPPPLDASGVHGGH